MTTKLPKDSFPETQITKRFKGFVRSFRSPLLDVYGLSEQVFSRKRRNQEKHPKSDLLILMHELRHLAGLRVMEEQIIPQWS